MRSTVEKSDKRLDNLATKSELDGIRKSVDNLTERVDRLIDARTGSQTDEVVERVNSSSYSSQEAERAVLIDEEPVWGCMRRGLLRLQCAQKPAGHEQTRQVSMDPQCLIVQAWPS